MKKDQTVQLLPERLFFILSDKKGYGEPYKTMVPAYPHTFLMQPIQVNGNKFCIGVQKDEYIAKLLLFCGEMPYKGKTSREEVPIALTIAGGKISTAEKKVYWNKLYHDMKIKSSARFDPIPAISLIYSELEMLTSKDPFPTSIKLDLDDVEKIQTFDLLHKEKSVCY